MPWNIVLRGLCFVACAGLMACNAVSSSELKSAKAVDVELEATISEYLEGTETDVSAVLKTLESQVEIEFSQGETLTVAADSAAGISANVVLEPTSALIDLNNTYVAKLQKTAAQGSYHITYTDQDAAVTQVQVPTGAVAAITSPAAGTVLPESVTVQWDPSQMPTDGEIAIVSEWKASGSTGFRIVNELPNTGSHLLDLTDCQGSGAIKLVNTKVSTSLPGFGKSDVRMKNISQIAVTFSKGTPIKSLAPLTAAETIEDITHECTRYCAPNEELYYLVGDERIDCCVR